MSRIVRNSLFNRCKLNENEGYKAESGNDREKYLRGMNISEGDLRVHQEIIHLQHSYINEWEDKVQMYNVACILKPRNYTDLPILLSNVLSDICARWQAIYTDLVNDAVLVTKRYFIDDKSVQLLMDYKKIPRQDAVAEIMNEIEMIACNFKVYCEYTTELRTKFRQIQEHIDATDELPDMPVSSLYKSSSWIHEVRNNSVRNNVYRTTVTNRMYARIVRSKTLIEGHRDIFKLSSPFRQFGADVRYGALDAQTWIRMMEVIAISISKTRNETLDITKFNRLDLAWIIKKKDDIDRILASEDAHVRVVQPILRKYFHSGEDIERVRNEVEIAINSVIFEYDYCAMCGTPRDEHEIKHIIVAALRKNIVAISCGPKGNTVTQFNRLISKTKNMTVVNKTKSIVFTIFLLLDSLFVILAVVYHNSTAVVVLGGAGTVCGTLIAVMFGVLALVYGQLSTNYGPFGLVLFEQSTSSFTKWMRGNEDAENNIKIICNAIQAGTAEELLANNRKCYLNFEGKKPGVLDFDVDITENELNQLGLLTLVDRDDARFIVSNWKKEKLVEKPGGYKKGWSDDNEIHYDQIQEHLSNFSLSRQAKVTAGV